MDATLYGLLIVSLCGAGFLTGALVGVLLVRRGGRAGRRVRRVVWSWTAVWAATGLCLAAVALHTSTPDSLAGLAAATFAAAGLLYAASGAAGIHWIAGRRAAT
jgi:hypothetical protein